MREFLKNGTNLLLRRQGSILSAAFVIMVTYGLSHIVGLVKTRLIISHFFGSTASTLDVYYAALVVPDTIFQLLVIGSLSAAFIPTFTRLLHSDQSQAWKTAAAAMNLVVVAFVVICTVVAIFAYPLSSLIAPGFDLNQIKLMVGLLRVMLVAQIFFAVSGFLTAVVQSHQRFLIPALAPVVYNLGIILGTLFLAPTLGIYGPVVGMVLGAFLHMVIQIPVAYRLGFRFKLTWNWQLPGVRETLRLMPPRTLALGIDQVEQFVAVILASALASGSLTLLNVARLLYTIPTLLFGVTIGQAALPSLSQISAKKDSAEFVTAISASILQVVFLALPASVLLIILRIPVVRIAFGAKTFPWEATLLTGQTVAILAISAVFYAVMQLVIRGFYALHDTKTPLIVGLAAAAINTLVGVFLVTVVGWGIPGIAAAISLTAIGETLALTILLATRLKYFALWRRTLRQILKMTLVGLITGLSLWGPMRLLDKFIFDTTYTLPLITLTVITSVIGLGVYVGLSYIFRIDQLATLVALLRKLLRWRELIAPTSSEAIIVPAPDQN